MINTQEDLRAAAKDIIYKMLFDAGLRGVANKLSRHLGVSFRVENWYNEGEAVYFSKSKCTGFTVTQIDESDIERLEREISNINYLK